MKSAIALVLVLSTAWYVASASYMPLPHSATLRERNRGMPVHRQDDQERGRVQQQAALSARNQAYFHDYLTVKLKPIQSIVVVPMMAGGLGAVYRSPDKGRVTLYLYNDREDILLVVDARFAWRRETNTLVLNSKFADGEWGPEVRPEGFPFPCCEYVTTITVRVDIGAEGFTISANGIEIAKYPYRDGLPPPVTKFEYVFEDQDASEIAELESLCAYY